MKPLDQLVRPNIQALPHLAADGNAGGVAVRLCANESPYNTPLNRYPDPQQAELLQELSLLKGLRPDCIFPCCGSDEAIDLTLRIFCTPGRDNVVAIDPTRPAFARRAAINDVEYRRAPLDAQFGFTAESVLSLCNERTKVVFLCSPNDPTGNLLNRKEVVRLLDTFEGMVVADEAYIDFSGQPSLYPELVTHPNLIVLQSFSTAWASAAIRLGIVLAAPDVVDYFRKIAHPYGLSTATQQAAISMIRRRYDVATWVRQTLAERTKVVSAVRQLPFYVADFHSDANFFLVRFKGADSIAAYLKGEGIAVADCTDVRGCDDCLRISIGLPSENNALLGALRRYKP